ncbi:MAG: alcohol dehydrogenase catalytic domain-containing protein [Firmicutes bacterium]|nr:alcohol dehydrogenase catalytic domain-containing protein [Bacillota bacterium]
MKAAVMHEFGKPLVVEDVPVRPPAGNEVLVRVHSCGVCYSDVKLFKGLLPRERLPALPHILGHEIAGVVEGVGPLVRGVEPGTRVGVHFYATCGRCSQCRTGHEPLCENLINQIGFTCNGGYAEYVTVPGRNVVPLPGNVGFDEAGIAADAIATSVEAVKRTAHVGLADRVAIIGAGGLGIHAVQVARLVGAWVLAVDVSAAKLEQAAELGAHECRLHSDMGDCGAKLFDVVIDAVGRQDTVKTSLRLVRPGGRIIMLGYASDVSFSIPTPEIVHHQITVSGSRASSMQSYVEAITLLERGQLTPLISRRYPLEQATRALEDLSSGAVSGRAVLDIADQS